MSAVRIYGPDGRPTWRKADDGAVGRMSVAGSIRERLDEMDRLDAMDRATTRKNPDNGAVEASISEVQT